MKRVVYIFIFIALTNYVKGQAPVPNAIYTVGDSITDIDGNKYPTVIIQGKHWMAENLRTTHLNNGKEIESFQDGKKYGIRDGESQAPAYCWFKGKKDIEEHRERGALYNWFTVETQKVCPIGWHVSTVEEWDVLEKLADPTFVPKDPNWVSTETASKFLATGGWEKGFLNLRYGNNTFGLSIKPSGSRSIYNKFSSGFNSDAMFWTNRDEHLPTTLELHSSKQGSGIKFFDKVEKATEIISTLTGEANVEQPKPKSPEAVVKSLSSSSINHSNDSKGNLYSIRCVKN